MNYRKGCLLAGLLLAMILALSAGAALAQDDELPPDDQNPLSETAADGEPAGSPVMTEWVDKEGRQPTSFSAWELEQPLPEPTLVQKHFSSLDLREGAEAASERPFVLALVKSSLYGALAAELAQWQQDVIAEGWDVEIEAATFSTKLALRSHLAGKPSLDSVMLVGNFPVAWFEVDPGDSFPIDLYYMDLDGRWTNSESAAPWTNALDTHTGDQAAEISLGRLLPGKMTFGASEVTLLKDYFLKNHAYRTGDLSRRAQAVNIVDNDWAWWSDSYDALSLLYPGQVQRIANPWETSGATLREVLEQPNQWLLVEAHSSSYGHALYTTARINFQPWNSVWPGDPSHPSPWMDGGFAFREQYSSRYGWNQDMTGRAVMRTSPLAPDYRYNSLITMQDTTELTAVWEAEAPNGAYCVDHLIAGDPERYTGNYRIDLEGTTVLNGTPSAAAPFVQTLDLCDRSAPVNVTDGRVTLSSHSGARKNRLAYIDLRLSGVSDWVSSPELYDLGPEALFYNLFACGSGRYVEPDYIGGRYLFNNGGPGLAAIASTKSGSMLGYSQFYAPLAAGASLGEAYRSWFNDVGIYNMPWHYGMTLLGDPTLTMFPPTPPADMIYLSANREDSVSGIPYTRRDILGVTETGEWQMVFDASDVEIPAIANLNDFSMLDDGSILMVFDVPVILPGAGAVSPWDIARFVPTALGPDTSGTFEFYFDGSDVGLSATGEKIDALHAVDGNLYLSTTGAFALKQGGVTLRGADEDILEFTPASLGSSTAGSWTLYLDGSLEDPGLGSEDIAALSMTGYNPIYISLQNAFTIAGASGTQKDILKLWLVETSGSIYWHGPDDGFRSAIDGLHVP